MSKIYSIKLKKSVNVNFMGQEISPVMINGKNAILFKYNYKESQNIKKTEMVIKKILQGYPNYKNLQFRINLYIENSNTDQKWFMSPIMKYDEIDLKDNYDYLKDSIDFYYTQSMVSKFEFLIKSTKTRKIKTRRAGTDNHNDCIYNCIYQSFGYNKELMKMKQPHKLKEILGYERNDKIELTDDNLKKIEELFNISFTICGDLEYKSKEMKHFNINLKLQNEHVKLLCNENRETRLYERKEQNIYTYCFESDNVIYFDGNNKTVINIADYDNLKKQEILLIQCKNSDELENKRNEYLNKSKIIKKETKGMINFYKSGYHSNIAYDIFKTVTKSLTEPQQLDIQEHYILDRAFRGGLHYAEKGEFEDCYDYDLNAMYSTYMNSSDFNFPTSKPEYKTITEDEFNKFTTFYPYGIYNVIITGKHKYSYLPTDKEIWVCHYDLNNCKKMNLNISINNVNNNALIYKDRIKGYKVFSTFTNMMEKYINIEELQDYKQDIKKVRNSLWGYMARKNTKQLIIKKDSNFSIDDYFLEEYENRVNCVSIKITDKNEIFKNSWCRMSIFLTAYCRYKMMDIILKNDTDNNIICVNTDGFISTKKLNLDIGANFGQWKIKNKGTATIHNSNMINWN
jgi:hypothetical protein